MGGSASSRTSAALAGASTSLAPTPAAPWPETDPPVGGSRRPGDGRKLSSLELLGGVPHRAASALIYVDLCGREGLYGVGAHVSGDERPNTEAGEPLGRLDPSAPPGVGAGVFNRLHR